MQKLERERVGWGLGMGLLAAEKRLRFPAYDYYFGGRRPFVSSFPLTVKDIEFLDNNSEDRDGASGQAGILSRRTSIQAIGPRREIR
jgi:hypothetical protein